MGYSKLELRLLSKWGEPLRTITCRCGFITVLRAFSPVELGAYQRMLAGAPGPERYAILLDDQPFNPVKHLLIGFGENPRELKNTVEEYLHLHGVSEALLPSLLISFGLEGAREKKMSDLSPSQIRQTQLLAAAHTKDKVAVLNNPFEPLANEWKERFAELLASQVRTLGGIIVIPSLDFRPDCWIENEVIVRVQVGEHRQKTIGFDSAPNPYHQVIDAVRKGAQDSRSGIPENSGTQKFASPERLFPTEPSKQIDQSAGGRRKATGRGGEKPLRAMVLRLLSKDGRTPRPAVWLSMFGIIAAAAYLSVDQISSSRKRPPLSLREPAPSPSPNHLIGPGDQSAAGASTPAAVPDAASKPEMIDAAAPISDADPHADPAAIAMHNPDQAEASSSVMAPPSPPADSEVRPEAVKAIYVLDHYAPEIRRSILETFEGDSSFQKPGATPAARPTAASQGAVSNAKLDRMPFELLKALKSAENSDRTGMPSAAGRIGPPPADLPFPHDFTDMDKEERRALMRERFRQLIERASQTATP